MSTGLAVGLVLTALAYAGLWWAVIHGKHVVEQVKRGEYPHHPNPKHRPDTDAAVEGSPSSPEHADE